MDYCGIYVNYGIYKNSFGVFFGSKKDKANYSENVFLGFRRNKNEELAYKLTSKFDSDNNWIWKHPKDSKWGNSPEIWEDVAKGKDSEIYKEIINIINEFISIENSIQ